MTDFDTQAARLAASIEEEIFERRMAFPSSFELVLRIKKLADQPDSSLDDIARLVRAEPLLSARVVRMANAVLLNPYGGNITNVTDAVRRIGLATLRCLSFAVSAEQLALAQQSPTIRAQSDALWRHSADTACWAWALARSTRKTDADTAMFAAMLLNIGQFFLLARTATYPALGENPERFAELVRKHHLAVTHALLEALDVPDPVVVAMTTMPRTVAWPPQDLAGILSLAEVHARTPSPFVGSLATSSGAPDDTDALHEAGALQAQMLATLMP